MLAGLSDWLWNRPVELTMLHVTIWHFRGGLHFAKMQQGRLWVHDKSPSMKRLNETILNNLQMMPTVSCRHSWLGFHCLYLLRVSLWKLFFHGATFPRLNQLLFPNSVNWVTPSSVKRKKWWRPHVSSILVATGGARIYNRKSTEPPWQNMKRILIIKTKK